MSKTTKVAASKEQRAKTYTEADVHAILSRLLRASRTTRPHMLTDNELIRLVKEEGITL